MLVSPARSLQPLAESGAQPLCATVIRVHSHGKPDFYPSPLSGKIFARSDQSAPNALPAPFQGHDQFLYLRLAGSQNGWYVDDQSDPSLTMLSPSPASKTSRFPATCSADAGFILGSPRSRLRPSVATMEGTSSAVSSLTTTIRMLSLLHGLRNLVLRLGLRNAEVYKHGGDCFASGAHAIGYSDSAVAIAG